MTFGGIDTVATSGSSQFLEAKLAVDDPDVRLMLQVRDDVAGSFEVLVRRYQDRLHGVLAHMVGDDSTAEDLSQEVFLRVYRARKGYRPKSKFSTWLFMIAHNLALNHFRSKRRHPTEPIDPATDRKPSRGPAQGLVAPGVGASTQIRREELGAVVREAVASLDDDQRIAVLLNKFEAMRYAEIAEVMNRSESSIKSLLARSRMQLRERLEPYLRAGEPPNPPGRPRDHRRADPGG